jgi:peptide/nickel transport system ATP-binding protein
MAKGNILLGIKDLVMYYNTLRGDVKAVDNVTFNLGKGEALGLVGESGCGKTSTMLTILRLLPFNARILNGAVDFDGVNLLDVPKSRFRKEIRWNKISTVFQGAMNALHPMMTVGKQISEAILLHENVSKKEASKRTGDLLELVGIERAKIDRYPHELSGGMKQRVMIAMSIASNPELVIADEPTTALDVIIAAQVLELLKELQRKLKVSLILVSHDLAVVAEVCDKVAIMYAGKIVENGTIMQVFKKPHHPYSEKLLGAFPSIIGEKTKLVSIGGFPPDLIDPPEGCRFYPRCSYAMEICRKKEPVLRDTGNGHLVSCHLC